MGIEHFDSFEEMTMFGFDPANEEDVEKWKATAPETDELVTDYTQDGFEFGSPPSGQSS